MRLYTFCHAYMSSIQQGIQSAHILGNIVKTYYDRLGEKGEMVRDFLSKHKTMIVCNGGNSASLDMLEDFFLSCDNPYPWSSFCEDEDSMEGMMTGLGIILPEEIYGATLVDDCFQFNDIMYHDGFYEYELIKRIKTAPLAR